MQIKEIDSSQFKELDDIDHAIKRASMYIGSVKRNTVPQYLFFGDGKIHLDDIQYVQGGLILASEIINNAYDEYVRRRGDANLRNIDTIDVTVNLDEKSLRVRDNGGMPIALHTDTGVLLPSLLFGRLKSGGNFENEDGSNAREDVGGLNGMGSMLVNIFSKEFTATVYEDGESKMFQQTWRNSSRDTYNTGENPAHWDTLLFPCEPQTGSVEIYAKLNESMLSEGAYNMDWARMVEIRCAMIASMAAGSNAPLRINFTCESKDVNWSQSFQFDTFEDYLKLFPNSESYAIDKNDRFTVAVSLSGGSFESMGVVNGLSCWKGTHIKRYVDACAFHIREHIKVRHNIDVKPAKILSYLKVVSAFRVNAPTFGGQTKEELVTELGELGYDPIPSKQMISKLIHSQITAKIVEELHHQIMAQRKAALTAKEKERAKKSDAGSFSPKYLRAAEAGRKPGCMLFVVEGDSAAGGFKKHRRPDGMQGVLAMQGKSMGNVIYDDEVRVNDRPSFDLFMEVAGLSMIKKSKLRYDYFVLAQDADYDGNCITALLLVFLNKFFPWLIDEGRIYKLVTPLVIASKGNDRREFYTYDEYNAAHQWLEENKYEIKYHKGLSQIEDQDFEQMMIKPKLVRVTRDRDADLSMYTWFGKAEENKQMRKEYLIQALGQNVDADMAGDSFDSEVQSEFADDMDDFSDFSDAL